MKRLKADNYVDKKRVKELDQKALKTDPNTIDKLKTQDLTANPILEQYAVENHLLINTLKTLLSEINNSLDQICYLELDEFKALNSDLTFLSTLISQFTGNQWNNTALQNALNPPVYTEPVVREGDNLVL